VGFKGWKNKTAKVAAACLCVAAIAAMSGCAAQAASAAGKPSATGSTSAAEPPGGASQDAHDDRPDDANDRPDEAKATADTSSFPSAAVKKWAAANSFDLEAFENPPDPTAIAPHEPTAEDITLFKEWIATGGNPRNMVMKAVTEDVGETVANEMWDYLNVVWSQWMSVANVGSVVSKTSGLKNVGATQEGQFAAYFASFFPDLMKGSGPDGGGEYSSVVTLINEGFIVSSDGTTWRLHNAADGSIVYELPASEVAAGQSAAFAAVVSSDGTVYWKSGVDSWDKLMQLNSLADDDSVLKVQVLPDSAEKYPYLHPDATWTLTLDGDAPSWYTDTTKAAIMAAFDRWKGYAYTFDLDGFLDYFDTLPADPVKPTEADIALLKKWAAYKADPAHEENKFADDSDPWVGDSIWNDAAQYLNDTFGEVYGQCPGPTVVRGIEATGVTLDAATEDRVGSSVGEKEFLGIFFTNTAKWAATGTAEYPYTPIAELWKRGFIPSFDGTTWRLSSGKEGTIVYAATAADLAASADTQAAGSGGPRWGLVIGIGGGVVVVAALVVLTVVLRKKKVSASGAAV
jgi:hypothetical protein